MPDQSGSSEKPDTDTRFEFGQSTRRTFLSRLGIASLLATTGPVVTMWAQRSEKVVQGLATKSKDAIPVSLRVNGKNYRFANRSPHNASRLSSRAFASDRIEKRMRSRTVRRVHGAHQWPARTFVSFLCRSA